MKSVTVISNHHNRGLFAAITLAVFAVTIIFIGSFAAMDADDGTEETRTLESYDADVESPDDNSGNIRINFKSNNSNWGTVTHDGQSVPLPDSSIVTAAALALGDIGVVITLRITIAIVLPIPTWLDFNFAIPADGYEIDHWTMNGKQSGSFKFVPDLATFVAHFKEKGTEIVP